MEFTAHNMYKGKRMKHNCIVDKIIIYYLEFHLPSHVQHMCRSQVDFHNSMVWGFHWPLQGPYNDRSLHKIFWWWRDLHYLLYTFLPIWNIYKRKLEEAYFRKEEAFFRNFVLCNITCSLSKNKNISESKWWPSTLNPVLCAGSF